MNVQNFKFLLTGIILLITQDAFSQFVMTKEGMKNAEDKTKTFVVLSYDNISKSEMYKKALVTITGIYVSPQDVISKVEDETISVHGFEKNIPFGKNEKNPLDRLDLDYVMKFNFKDSKMRVEVFFNSLLTSYSKLLEKRIDLTEKERGYGKIFTKEGEPNFTATTDHINSLFNDIVKKVDESIKGVSAEDNW